jgi:poly-beta-1,6-N-acetyl-D-glucosamine biosynthesis protein PgaD
VKRPIIRSRVPRWMLARDVLLTLGAWMIIAYFFHEGIARAYDYFSQPMFQLTRMSPPDWAYRWEKLRGFIAASAVLVLWIAFWAFDSRTRMRATSSPQPAPLDAAEYARRVGLKVGDLEVWRTAKIQTADIDATLHITNHTISNPTAP